MARSSKYSDYPPLTDNQEPAFTGITRHEFTDKNLQEARLIVLWRVPGLGELKDTYALDVLAGILGQGRSSRLVQDLREERGLVSTISVSNSNYKLQGLFTISAKCNEEDLAAVETGIVEHLEKLQTELVKESEILRVQTRVANRFIFNNETPGERSGLYGYYQCLFGDLEPAFDYPQYIRMQNEYDLMKAAQKYLLPQAYRAVIIRPR
jgi:predicted Zn-dependent peptidase